MYTLYAASHRGFIATISKGADACFERHTTNEKSTNFLFSFSPVYRRRSLKHLMNPRSIVSTLCLRGASLIRWLQVSQGVIVLMSTLYVRVQSVRFDPHPFVDEGLPLVSTVIPVGQGRPVRALGDA